jgi:zinc transport system substrate-binding protein
MTCRRLAYLGLLLWLPASAALLSGCGRAKDEWEGKGGPPRVVVSFPPLYSFVKSVGGDHVGVLCLCTVNDPHEFEYRPEQAVLLRKADLLVGVGLGLDGSGPGGGPSRFTDKLHASSGKPKLPFVKVGHAIDKKLLHKDEDEDRKEEGEGQDPHIWLGVPQAKASVYVIRDELIKLDGGHRGDYEKNAADFAAKLDELRKYGDEKLAGKSKKLITSHDSLHYFADTFELEIVAYLKVDPGSSTETKKLADLVNKVIEEEVGVLAIEPRNPSAKKDADVLLEEINKKLAERRKSNKDYKKGFEVKVAEIDPLETVEKADELSADWYLKKMRANIDELADKLPKK